jgi:LysM repeat protein
VIQKGDTLTIIARKFNVTVQAILAVNPQITNPNLIFAGRTIKIPCPPGMG